DQPFDLALGVLVGIALAALGVVGDLTVSLLKRTFGVKDASKILPGHGGLLDRLDSFILAGPALYFILLIWGR
ncbi:MAG: phosphatidate cytidylyltransferase, partial [Deltaproteobacteria bacterium]|nr:phosphatidate cytidylyltransferase [Deltaproteobacteria bacterium]